MIGKLDLNKHIGQLDGIESARLYVRDWFKRASTGKGLLTVLERRNLTKDMIDYDRNNFDRLIKACDKELPEMLWEFGFWKTKFELTCCELDKIHLSLIMVKGLLQVHRQLETDIYYRVITEDEYAQYQAGRGTEEPITSDFDDDFYLVIKGGKDNPLLGQHDGDLYLRKVFKSSISFLGSMNVLEVVDRRFGRGDRVRFKQGFGKNFKMVVTEYRRCACQLLKYSSTLDRLFSELQFNPCEEIWGIKLPVLVSRAKQIAEYHNILMCDLLRDEVAEAIYGIEQVTRELENRDDYFISEFKEDSVGDKNKFT